MSLCKNLSRKCVRLAAFVSLVAASALAVQAQVVFSPPKNISNSSGNTLAQQFQFALDAKGNVNMVWVDNSPGNYVVLFSRSSDGGVTFSAPRNISNNTTSTFSFNPKLALDSAGNIFIAWADNSQGHYANFFSRSADGGATFSAPLMISHAGASALGAQVVASSAGNVDIVWADDSLGYFAVFSTRSADSGASFSAPLQLSQNANLSSFGPMESVDSSGNINVMWTDSGMSNYIRYSDLLFSRSVDGGATFSAPYTVDSQTNGYSQPGGISDAQFGTDASGNINVVWSRGFYNGDWDELDVLLARSTDGGATFSSPAEISSRFGGGRYPKVALGPSGDINIAYFTNPSFPFFYPSGITTTLARSLDGGATFFWVEFGSLWRHDCRLRCRSRR